MMYRPSAALFLVMISLALTCRSASAQAGPVGLRQPSALAPHQEFGLAQRDAPSTQWKRGMLIGGVAGLALDLLIAWPISRSNETGGSFNPLGFLPLIAVGALIGGLIGSSFRK